PVMFFIGSFMAEKIPVRPCFFKGFIAFSFFFSNGQGNGTVRKFFPDLIHQFCDPLVIVIGILPSLEYKGAESQTVSRPAAFQDLSLGKPVSGSLFVAFPDAAVVTVISAVIGKFYQPPDKNPFSIDPVS